MSQKHYIAVAAIIKARIDEADVTRAAGERGTAEHIARDFAAIALDDNPRFDTARFLAACGVK